MNATTVERIFDPFFSTKPTGKGTGLGLSVVHGIIAAHRGVMKVYSKPAKGTTFYIYLPAVSESVNATATSEPSAPTGRGERLLFFDDEGVLLFVGTMTLEQNGYLVTGVPNGEAALRELHDKAKRLRRGTDGFVDARHVWSATSASNPQLASGSSRDSNFGLRQS